MDTAPVPETLLGRPRLQKISLSKLGSNRQNRPSELASRFQWEFLAERCEGLEKKTQPMVFQDHRVCEGAAGGFEAVGEVAE
jgi:hypothetical protein